MKSDGPAIFSVSNLHPPRTCGYCEEGAQIRASVYMLRLSVTLLDDPAVRLYLGRATRSAKLLPREAHGVIESIWRA